jgi:hypothetical protein
MLSLTIENKKVEDIFLKEFHSDKESFFAFIQSSFEKLHSSDNHKNHIIDLKSLQESAMAKTWENDKDKVWDEL